MKYSIPNDFYFRLHHVRPRFKNDVESVLLFMANEISKIPSLPKEDFKNTNQPFYDKLREDG